MRSLAWKRVVSVLLVGLAGCDLPQLPDDSLRAQFEASHSPLREALLAMDDYRVPRGCPRLRWDDRLATIAAAYAKQMNEGAFFGHVDPDGTELKHRLERGGVRGFRSAAEIIAAGQPTGSRAVVAWIESEPHRRIVENCRFSHIGIGADSGSGPYQAYWTAILVER